MTRGGSGDNSCALGVEVTSGAFLSLAPVPGYPRYLVTDHGQVWSTRSGKFLKPTRDREGYLRVHLYPGGKTMPVHRLVLLTFVGPCPEGYQTRHLNGESDDPRLRNLIWGTKEENRKDKIRHGTLHRGGAKGERNHSAKLTEEQVREIRRLPHSHRQLARMFGVSPRTIRNILRRTKWKHVV